MKKPIQRIIAKEIIIFFSAVAIVGLVCIVSLCIGWYGSYRNQKLDMELKQLSNNADSLQSLFPKVLTFEEMIVGDLPKKYKIYQEFDRYLNNYDKLKIDDKQILQLFNLTFGLDYNFKKDGKDWPNDEFSKTIKAELKDLKWERKTNLNRIYTFLKDKKYITIPFEQFVFNLEGLPVPPKDSLLSAYMNKESKIKDVEGIRNRNRKYILADGDLEYTALSSFLVLMIIIYPIRFIFLSIVWAIRTLRTS